MTVQIEFTIRGEIDDEEVGALLNGAVVTTRHLGAMDMVVLSLEHQQYSDAYELLKGTVRAAVKEHEIAQMRERDEAWRQGKIARLRRYVKEVKKGIWSHEQILDLMGGSFGASFLATLWKVGEEPDWAKDVMAYFREHKAIEDRESHERQAQQRQEREALVESIRRGREAEPALNR